MVTLTLAHYIVDLPSSEFGHAIWVVQCPFGIYNLHDSIFHDKLDEFIIMYIDDIFVYFKYVEEHMETRKN